MIVRNKLMFSFMPRDFIKLNQVSFYMSNLNLTIDSENWPKNLLHNPDLIESEEMFYQTMCSDTTLYFYIESSIFRCKSLISRAVNNPDITWEHGNINTYKIDGECAEVWMIRTRTEVAFKEFKHDNQ